MGLVLWIDQNTFAANLVDKVFKKKGLSFYTLSKVDDFAYLIDDLNPEVIVLDAETALSHLEVFQAQYSSSVTFQNTPLILLNPKSGLEFIQKKIGEISSPLDPFGVHQQIVGFLHQFN